MLSMSQGALYHLACEHIKTHQYMLLGWLLPIQLHSSQTEVC